MNSVLTIVGIVGGIIGLLGGGAAAWVYFREGVTKATVEVYREDNTALRGRVETLEGERNELKNQVADLRGTVSALQEERAILRDLATGHSAVDALGEIILHQHNEQMTMLKSIHGAL